jgi:hypothetical protein
VTSWRLHITPPKAHIFSVSMSEAKKGGDKAKKADAPAKKEAAPVVVRKIAELSRGLVYPSRHCVSLY